MGDVGEKPHGSAKDVSAFAAQEFTTTAEPRTSTRVEQLSGWRLVAILAILCVGLLLSVMDASIVATALLTIGDDFNNFDKVIWAVLSYLLSYMGMSVIFARLSDVTGRKWAAILAWFIFTVFSLACGFATSLDQLIAFRALQGVGGSGLYTLTLVIVPEISPQTIFALMNAVVGGIFAMAAVLGPVLGGVITEKSTWRWIFWLNAPFGLLALLVLIFSWPGANNTVKKVKLAHVDWFGALLLLVASVLLIFGLVEGGSGAFAWNSGASIATFAISGVCWAVFPLWIIFLDRRHRAAKTAMEGIFPLSVVSRGKMWVVIIVTLLAGLPLLVVLIYLPQRYQVVQLKSPIRAGISILPFLLSTGIGTTIAGALSQKKNNTFWTLMGGSALTLLGCGLLSTAGLSLKIPASEYGYQILLGTGIGCVLATASIMSSLEPRLRDLAVAQGVVAQARVLGGSIGLAAAIIIFNHLAVSHLSSTLTPAELRALQKNPEVAYTFSLTAQLAVRSVFAESFRDQLRMCTYVSAAALVISLFAYCRNPPSVIDRKAAHDAYLEGRTDEYE